MPWNPDVYNQFKDIRYQPFFDLMVLISDKGLKKAVDIGCGTGEQTRILSEQFPKATFVGIDPSPEMLAKSKAFERKNLHFENTSVEAFIADTSPQQWDLLFSNAALQWSNDHEALFPQLIAKLSDRGQFAVQMPVQHENLLNKLLYELVQEKPFVAYLQGWKRTSPLLPIDQYAQLMFEHGLQDIQIIQKVYPIIADDADNLFDFISGSALVPYLERMSPSEQQLFIDAFKNRIQQAFKKFPAMYAFKRLLLYGKRT
ncbi:methyltransferase domain-containing protein [Spirosoma sp.]|uniref:methyltransferase domain-containing protein n=1 Tax=Spirosoma sp. TaxID=1899569 RepID=UPI003B3AF3BB